MIITGIKLRGDYSMRKLFITVTMLMMLFTTAVCAESVDDLNGDVTTGKKIELTGLTDGYYDLTVMCKNTTVDVNCYVYGMSEGYSMASTVLPKSESGVMVTVRGIGVYGGKCEIGVTANTKGVVEFSDIKLTASKEYSLVTGGDTSEVSYIESLGGVYKDKEGKAVDAYEYLASCGMNMARIRLSNTTGKGTGDGTYYLPGGFQDEADCLNAAKRAKAAGMGIQFTFNYSDYWSNGTRQMVPSMWAKQIKDELGYDIKDTAFLKSMTTAQKREIQEKLVAIIYDYTYDIMSKLKEQGTVPEYVSLGNEINGGMLFPFGNAYKANMNKDRQELVFDSNIDSANDIVCSDETTYMLKFLKSGYDAVKAVSPETQVIVHLATEGSGTISDGAFTWLMDKFVNAGVVDVLGASYYPAWSNSTAPAAADFAKRMYTKYKKPVMFMETGFNWNEKRKDGYGGQLWDIDAYKEIYPPSKDGHAGYMAELFNELKRAGEACVGVLYWDPCMIHVEDSENPNGSLSGWAIRESDDKNDVNVVENTALFDFDGVAIPSVDVFANTRESIISPLIGTEIVAENGILSATVNNISSEDKKVNLYVAVYDENGILSGVNIESKMIEAHGSAVVTASEPQENYKAFLWDGSSFAPVKITEEDK